MSESKDRQQVEREKQEYEAHERRERGAQQAESDAAKRKKSAIIVLGVTAAVVGAGAIAAVTLGDQDEPVTQAAYCVEQTSGTRVEDGQCETGNANGSGRLVGWYFIPMGWGAPPIGGRAVGGSFTTPGGTSFVQGGVPRAGGTVTTSNLSGGKTTTVRGGFGVKGGGVGG